MDAIAYRSAGNRPASSSSAWGSAVAQLNARLLNHPFLVRCADGSVTLDELRRFLIQHGKYSAYFTRYLCALISQLDSGEDVLRLARNLAEELGYGSESRVPHSRIYADILRDFDISLDQHALYPETQNLIDTMFMLCRQPGGLAGLGALCLGAEALVPAMYSCIVEGFRQNGVDDSRLGFFLIHMACDDDHADTMYSMIEALAAASRSAHLRVLNAGEIAVNARLRFFDALLKEVH